MVAAGPGSGKTATFIEMKRSQTRSIEERVADLERTVAEMRAELALIEAERRSG